eukprot:gnl/TRDRNA2_/TRDRNA2_125836_c0_seq1.p1 gnl/TRDRNA2_/TRDRNA2_125836_c0~~gnl/TRDRNA2_/TRDRNA2_125836_c0_seq1.p1  ORF type:complete len:464 (-),score=52.61 gnl/TRDRNA2_/TRDRNA2_125836_c0_seq1:35-1426(-)
MDRPETVYEQVDEPGTIPEAEEPVAAEEEMEEERGEDLQHLFPEGSTLYAPSWSRQEHQQQATAAVSEEVGDEAHLNETIIVDPGDRQPSGILDTAPTFGGMPMQSSGALVGAARQRTPGTNLLPPSFHMLREGAPPEVAIIATAASTNHAGGQDDTTSKATDKFSATFAERSQTLLGELRRISSGIVQHKSDRLTTPQMSPRSMSTITRVLPMNAGVHVSPVSSPRGTSAFRSSSGVRSVASITGTVAQIYTPRGGPVRSASTGPLRPAAVGISRSHSFSPGPALSGVPFVAYTQNPSQTPVLSSTGSPLMSATQARSPLMSSSRTPPMSAASSTASLIAPATMLPAAPYSGRSSSRPGTPRALSPAAQPLSFRNPAPIASPLLNSYRGVAPSAHMPLPSRSRSVQSLTPQHSSVGLTAPGFASSGLSSSVAALPTYSTLMQKLSAQYPTSHEHFVDSGNVS